MLDVNILDFVEFCTVDHERRPGLIRRVARQEEYAFYRDYWLPMRAAIRRFHTSGGLDSTPVSRAVAKALPKRKRNYTIVAAKFLNLYRINKPGRGTLLRGDWSRSGIRVRVRPEMTWSMEDGNTAVKLYLRKRSKPITPHIANLIGQLQCEVAEEQGIKGLNHAVLDAYHEFLLYCSVPSIELAATLHANAVEFGRLWSDLLGVPSENVRQAIVDDLFEEQISSVESNSPAAPDA